MKSHIKQFSLCIQNIDKNIMQIREDFPNLTGLRLTRLSVQVQYVCIENYVCVCIYIYIQYHIEIFECENNVRFVRSCTHTERKKKRKPQ